MLTLARNNRRRLAALTAAVMLFSVFGGFLPETSRADTYGPWFPAPGSGKAGMGYQTDIAPFNDSNIAEISNFSCVTSSGQPIEAEEKEIIEQIYSAAGLVFQGRWDVTSWDIDASDRTLRDLEQKARQGASSTKRTTDNGSYPDGTTGMQWFLRDELRLLNEGHWVTFDHREIEASNQDPSKPGDYRLPNGVVVNVDEANFGEVGTPKMQRRVASMIDASARHPLELTKGLPEGCSLETLTPPPPSFGSLLSNTGDGVTNLLLYVPGKLAASAYDLIYPYAFKYTFWTPHSERGDVMWDIPDSCVPHKEASKRQRKQIADACIGGNGGTPLGYTKSKRSVQNQNSWYLNVARFMQWMISGTYFLIMFTAATLFIFRGNRTTNLNLMRVMPRLILSILLTVFSGFIIGAVISFSNLLVQAIFDQNDVWTVGGVNAYLLQADNITGADKFVAQLVQIVVGAVTTFFFIMFVVGSLVRQLILIGVVVLAPVAIFCLINDRWRPNFDRWVRCLLAVAFTPVVLALIFKLGMSVNPLVLDPVGSFGELSGFLGLVMMLATLWAMTRVLKSAKNFVMAQSGVGSAMQGAGMGVAKVGGLLPGGAGIAAMGAGAALAHQGSQINQRGASLIPGDRRVAAGSAPSPAAGIAMQAGTQAASQGAAAAAGAVGGPPAQAAAAFGTKIAGDQAGQALSQWMQQRKAEQLAAKGISEISQSEYLRKKAISEAAKNAGHDPAAAIGGEVFEQNGQYFIRHSGAVQDPEAAMPTPIAELPAQAGDDGPKIVPPNIGGDTPPPPPAPTPPPAPSGYETTGSGLIIPSSSGTPRDPDRQREMADVLQQATAVSNRRSAAERARESANDLSALKGTAPQDGAPPSNPGGPPTPPPGTPAPPPPPQSKPAAPAPSIKGS